MKQNNIFGDVLTSYFSAIDLNIFAKSISSRRRIQLKMNGYKYLLLPSLAVESSRTQSSNYSLDFFRVFSLAILRSCTDRTYAFRWLDRQGVLAHRQVSWPSHTSELSWLEGTARRDEVRDQASLRRPLREKVCYAAVMNEWCCGGACASQDKRCRHGPIPPA